MINEFLWRKKKFYIMKANFNLEGIYLKLVKSRLLAKINNLVLVHTTISSILQYSEWILNRTYTWTE